MMVPALVLSLLAAAASPLIAERTPEEVIAAFFGPAGIADKESYYTGEMLNLFSEKPTLGQSLPPGIKIQIRSLSSPAARSVFGVTLSKDELTQDWYAFLAQEDGGCKLEAVRTLSLRGVPWMVLEKLQAKSQRTAEEEWTLQNLLLTFKSDAELKAFVLASVKQLDQVNALVTGGKAEAALSEAKKLHINSVKLNEAGRVELVIGGILDNTVGMMFVPTGSEPPSMTPSEYIYVEHVTGNWYLFKTT